MNIVYTENPLCSRVELDDHEAKLFWMTIKMDEMEELLFDAHFHMQDDRWNDMDAARRAVSPDYYMADEGTTSKLDERVNELHAHFMQELVSAHAGDCTCFPCSCSKCHAEGKLGVDTIPKLGKHPANYVHGVFLHEGVTTCQDAIAHLQGKTTLSETGAYALAWLIEYHATKLQPQSISTKE